MSGRGTIRLTGCKLIPETLLCFYVEGGMAAEIMAVPIADVGKLLAAATDARYRVAVLMASEAGLRIGEIRGLQWTDIKTSGTLTVRRAGDPRNNVGTPKHDKSRSVRLSPARADGRRHPPGVAARVDTSAC